MTPTQEQNPGAAAGDAKSWLTVAEALAYARVSRSTLYRWFRDGQLTAYKRGTAQTWIDKAELDEILRPKPADPPTG